MRQSSFGRFGLVEEVTGLSQVPAAPILNRVDATGAADKAGDEKPGDSSRREALRERFSVAQYASTNDRRFQNFSFFWQASALGLAAEAFLFTVALASGTSEVGRFIASSLSIIVALAALGLMHTQHGYQLIEGRWMDAIEAAQGWAVMGHADRRSERVQAIEDAEEDLQDVIGWSRRIPKKPWWRLKDKGRIMRLLDWAFVGDATWWWTVVWWTFIAAAVCVMLLAALTNLLV